MVEVEKMTRKEKLSLVLAACITLACIPADPAMARGGFGGGRGGGFGGGRDFGGRDFGDRGFGDRGFGDMRSDAYRDFDRAFDHPFDGGAGMDADRPSAFMSPGELSGAAARDPMDNGVRNYGDQRSLASDGGFSSMWNRPTSGVGGHSTMANRPTSGVGGMGSMSNRPTSGVGGGLGHGYQTARMSNVSLANQGRLVRNNFNNWNAFHGNWWANHPGGWYHHWWNDYWPWRWSSWGEWGGWWGIGGGIMPIYYDYGDTITYDDSGYVDYGNSPVCTQSDYYQQSYDLANSGEGDNWGDSAGVSPAPAPPVPNGSSAVQGDPTIYSKDAKKDVDWKPFGVYSLVQGGQNNSTTLFQICSNRKGQIRGNYYNALTNETKPIQGAVDQKIMRACWTVGDNKTVVYDTGVANLLKPESPVLIHFGKDSTQQWTLIRMKNPNAEQPQSKPK